jgi:hypothetical protein
MPTPGEDADENSLENLSASLTVKDGIKHDDFDFELHVEKEYFGAESTELQYEGSGSAGGKDFTFKGPVDLFRLKYALKDKFNDKLGFDQL